MSIRRPVLALLALAIGAAPGCTGGTPAPPAALAGTPDPAIPRPPPPPGVKIHGKSSTRVD